jgi:hypothetical protein
MPLLLSHTHCPWYRWGTPQRVVAPDGSAGDRFAYDVAIDGGGSALIGAYGAGPLDVFNGNNGMAHTVRRCSTGRLVNRVCALDRQVRCISTDSQHR